MIRNYALTFAAVTLRLELGLLQLGGLSFDLSVPHRCLEQLGVELAGRRAVVAPTLIRFKEWVVIWPEW